jgi:LacI family transcriptional regulator
MPTLKRVIVLVEHRYGYFRDVLRGIRTYARQGHPWILHTTDSAAEGLERLLALPPDGILGHTGGPSNYRIIKASGQPAVHTVRVTEKGHAPYVVTDDLAVGRMAAEHLLSLGLRNFAFAGEKDFPHARLRFEGFVAGIRGSSSGATAFEYRGSAPPSREFGALDGETRFVRWLATLPRPIGLFAVNDTWATTIADRCHEAGVHIPDEVALLGVDNDDLVCESAWPPLSSIQTPGQRIGYEAARLLDDLMEGRPVKTPQVLLPPVQVVARESTNALPTASSSVVKAVRFIRAHSSEPLTVSEIVHAACVSRRLLEIRFRAELGCSLLEAIHRAHVDRARHLLLETDMAMPDIAESAGFPNATRMGIIFNRLTGTPPSIYRKQLRISGGRNRCGR